MDAVNEIKQKLDIVDVIGSYISTKKAGKNYQALCPFHSENTPSFNISPDLQIFKCFGCGESGDVISFVEKIEGIDFADALQILADKAGVVLQKDDFDSSSKLKQRYYYINDLTAKFYNYLLTKHTLGKPGLDYFVSKRKLTTNTIKDFLLGYAPSNGNILINFLLKKGISLEEMLAVGVIVPKQESKDYIDKFRGRVIFPLMAVDGKIIGFSGRTIADIKPKYLNTPETLIFHKGNFVYALNRAKLAVKKEGAVLVEGNMDVISAHQNGLTNVIAASGTAVTVAQLQLISRYTKDITLSLDADSAGINAAFRAVDLAEKLGFNIKVFVTPTGYKDLDELIKEMPVEAAGLIKKAVPAYDFFIAAALKLHNPSTPEGKKTIMEDLIPKFSRIQNKVLLDHYSGEIAQVLGLSKDTVFSLLSDKTTDYKNVSFTQTTVSHPIQPDKPGNNIDTYFVSLLIKLPYDQLKQKLTLIAPDKLIDEDASYILKALNDYLATSRDFQIQQFFSFIEKSAINVAQDLYISGTQYDASAVEAYLREIDLTADRIKKDSIKRHLKDIAEKIKLAEKENNDKLIAELTVQFKELSKELII